MNSNNNSLLLIFLKNLIKSSKNYNEFFDEFEELIKQNGFNFDFMLNFLIKILSNDDSCSINKYLTVRLLRDVILIQNDEFLKCFYNHKIYFKILNNLKIYKKFKTIKESSYIFKNDVISSRNIFIFSLLIFEELNIIFKKAKTKLGNYLNSNYKLLLDDNIPFYLIKNSSLIMNFSNDINFEKQPKNIEENLLKINLNLKQYKSGFKINYKLKKEKFLYLLLNNKYTLKEKILKKIYYNKKELITVLNFYLNEQILNLVFKKESNDIFKNKIFLKLKNEKDFIINLKKYWKKKKNNSIKDFDFVKKIIYSSFNNKIIEIFENKLKNEKIKVKHEKKLIKRLSIVNETNEIKIINMSQKIELLEKEKESLMKDKKEILINFEKLKEQISVDDYNLKLDIDDEENINKMESSSVVNYPDLNIRFKSIIKSEVIKNEYNSSNEVMFT